MGGTPQPTPKEHAVKKFEGRAVVSSKLSIRGAGEGLSQALAMDPIELHVDDEVYVLLKGKVRNIAFPQYDTKDSDNEDLCREHILDTEHATIVTAEFAEAEVAASKEALTKKLEEAAGILRLGDEAKHEDRTD